MPTLTASVQYDDWRGTAAADDADMKSIRSYLTEHGLLSDEEFLIGFEMYSGQQSTPGSRYFSARAFLIKAKDYESAQQAVGAAAELSVATRDLNISLETFLSFFKRFDVILTQKSLSVDGREYTELPG